MKEMYSTELFLHSFVSLLCYFEANDTSLTRRKMSVRRAYIRRFSNMKNIRRQRCMRARTSAETCKERAKRNELMSLLEYSGSNSKLEKQKKTKKLSKNILSGLLLSGWLFLCRVYSLLRRTYQVGHIVYLDMSRCKTLISVYQKLLKEWNLKYLGSDVILTSSVDLDHARRTLRRM